MHVLVSMAFIGVLDKQHCTYFTKNGIGQIMSKV